MANRPDGIRSAILPRQFGSSAPHAGDNRVAAPDCADGVPTGPAIRTQAVNCRTVGPITDFRHILRKTQTAGFKQCFLDAPQAVKSLCLPTGTCQKNPFFRGTNPFGKCLKIARTDRFNIDTANRAAVADQNRRPPFAVRKRTYLAALLLQEAADPPIRPPCQFRRTQQTRPVRIVQTGFPIGDGRRRIGKAALQYCFFIRHDTLRSAIWNI